MLRLTLATILFLTANLAMAADGEHLCKSGKLERKVNIVELEAGKKAPCEVKYTKENGEEKVLYSAKADESYCSTKAHEFMGKLKELGWECPE
ncbi:MAG: hypothetical protein KF767_09345 [Bdellovibrionaceae bacterium]|nr:hypothetical protein [Pseudobdellovibrionaceae bacterium]